MLLSPLVAAGALLCRTIPSRICTETVRGGARACGKRLAQFGGNLPQTLMVQRFMSLAHLLHSTIARVKGDSRASW